MNTASIYDSAMAGLHYAQAGMVATSQNVTGSNVAGYVRRNPNLQISTMSPSSVEAGGTAFSVEGFTRNFNALLQGQLLSQQSKTSFTATLTQAVSTLDAMLVDPAASIAKALGNFFNAAGSLANDPENQAYQQALTGAALQVGDRIRGMADLVGSLQSDSRQGLADVLNQANTLAPQLADINVRIKNATVPGVSFASGDLLDERDRITSKLQSLIGGTTTINEDGTASYAVDGIQLVDRVRANRFSSASGASTITPDEGLLSDLYLAIPGSPQPSQTSGNFQINSKTQVTPLQASAFKDGQAGAYVVLTKNFVPTLQKTLNLLSLKLVDQVNRVSSGPGTPAIASIFGFSSTTSAGTAITDLTAEQTVNQRPVSTLLASASFDELVSMANPASSQYSVEVDTTLLNPKFDARLFKSVASMAQSQFTNLTSTAATTLEELRSTFSSPVTFITSSVANTISTWNNQHKTNEVMVQVLSDQKNAISGVNLDEEAANLVKYQQLYNAASKLIQTNRQMFDTLLAMLAGN